MPSLRMISDTSSFRAAFSMLDLNPFLPHVTSTQKSHSAGFSIPKSRPMWSATLSISSSPSPLLLLLFPFFSSPSSLPHSRDCHTLPSSVNLLIIISITSPTFASLSRSHRSLQHKQQTARKSTSPRPVLNAYTFTLNRSLLIDPQLPIVHIYSLPLSSSPIALDHSALGLAATPIVAVAQHAVQQSPPNCFRRCRLPTSRLQLAHQQESLQPWACSAPFCTRRSLALPF